MRIGKSSQFALNGTRNLKYVSLQRKVFTNKLQFSRLERLVQRLTARRTMIAYWSESLSNISKTSTSVWMGAPNTEKLWMHEAANRSSAFIVSKCLESPFKHEVRVFETTSQSIKIDVLIACSLNSSMLQR